MDNNILDFSNTQENESVLVKSFLTKVFTWMVGALAISGIVAWLFATNAQLSDLLYRHVDGQIAGFTTLGYVAMFAPLVFILVMNFGLEKLALPVILTLFVLYSITMGMSLSVLLFMYAKATIAKTFLISAGAFGFMAFLGATTKTDLTKFGSYLYMGLFGVIIASVINAFTGGGTFLIDILCVVIFTGLASYKVQMLKNMALQTTEGSEQTQKAALFGALSLYITFINLFLTLLRLAGGRR
jgi:FtsH-binding integral membrane protein